MNHKEQVRECMSTLKDFQKATVDHVVKKMNEGQNKFLIADEVGLGKTIVAKGILASLYEQQYSPAKDFRVIYICSNQALAKQNLDKLNFIKDKAENIIEYNDQDDRLTSLAYEPKDVTNEYRLKIKALTPATSFDNKTKAGKADERVLLFRLLMHVPGMEYRRTSLKWFLRGGQRISQSTWNWKIGEAIRFERGRPTEYEVRPIREEVYYKFEEALNNPLSEANQIKIFGDVKYSRSILSGLLHILEERKEERSFANKGDNVFKEYYSLIPELRLQLSYVCKAYLKADIFILDEFQRFNQLIKQEETRNKGEELARAIFSNAEAKVLLLSATPFKAYTNSFDEHHGENHYKEFRTVLYFLYRDKPASFWEELEGKNGAFFDGIKKFGLEPTNRVELLSLKENIEEVYRQCITRTERTLVEHSLQDKTSNGVIPLTIQADDVNDFIAIDEIIVESNKINSDKLSNPVEYVKSAPFPLSFLQDYDHHKVLKKNYAENPHLQKLIKQSKKAFVPIDRINAYKALLPEKSVNEPNPKLRLLYEETVRKYGFKLLWIPPSLKYYQTKGGAFINADSFSKTLIFSSWKMVPRMVSALVSYEAERLSIGKLFDQEEVSKQYNYRDKRRYPGPLLTFRKSESGLSGMNNLMLAYPSIYLASLYKPVKNLVDNKDLNKIRLELKSKIIVQLKALNILSLGNKSGNTQKWDWLAVLLLDRNAKGIDNLKEWLKDQESDPAHLFDIENETDNQENDTHKSAKQIHFQEIRNFILTGNLPEVGQLNKEQLYKLAEHLTELCLGAPGVSALRALEQIYPAETINNKLTGALNVGMGMISMFNKPESIAIVKVAENENFYYQNVLSYSIDGNIQAMLDEFFYQLADSGGMSECLKAAELVKNILMVGGSKVDVMTEQSLKDDQHFSMRTHYAVPFGSSSSNDLKNGKRQIKVREAFNSPFRPFVLTSTSIGQEGLDFHYYCKRIIHWNLPNNPIDIEQREGRIKRYKSLLVRKNVAELYRSYLQQTDLNTKIWDALFAYASQEKQHDKVTCDLIPYWHINTQDNKIDSIIPLYKYSKDISKYNHIKTILANYRLTFGQPNQEDLVFAIAELPKEQQQELKQLLINLCPLQFNLEP